MSATTNIDMTDIIDNDDLDEEEKIKMAMGRLSGQPYITAVREQLERLDWTDYYPVVDFNEDDVAILTGEYSESVLSDGDYSVTLGDDGRITDVPGDDAVAHWKAIERASCWVLDVDDDGEEWRLSVCSECKEPCQESSLLTCSKCGDQACEICTAKWGQDATLHHLCPNCPQVVYISWDYFDETVDTAPDEVEAAKNRLIEACEERWPNSHIEVIPACEIVSNNGTYNYRFTAEPTDEMYESCWE